MIPFDEALKLVSGSVREQFLLGELKFDNASALVTASSPQSSAHFKPALSANCLARIPSGTGPEPSGSVVEIWQL